MSFYCVSTWTTLLIPVKIHGIIASAKNALWVASEKRTLSGLFQSVRPCSIAVERKLQDKDRIEASGVFWWDEKSSI